MTALEAIQSAHAAGLVLEPVTGGLRVRGPKSARIKLLPVLAPLAADIVTTLATRDIQSPTPSPGRLGDKPPCDECHKTDWHFALVGVGGDRTCFDCATGRTALRRRGVPI